MRRISFSKLYQDLQLIKEHSPLIHNVTNFVVMQTTANVLLAVGASPIMSHAKEELREIVTLANALVLNIGTLDEVWVESMALVQDIALKQKIPIIFDPVGSGASDYRTKVAVQILEKGVNVLRGNASEIISLIDKQVMTKGVDSTLESKEAVDAAITLSKRYQCCVVVSGKIDIICDGEEIIYLDYGTSLLTRVVGMGCSATSLIGAFASINTDSLLASTHAMAFLGKASEIAEIMSQGPGSFYSALLDVLYNFKKFNFNNINEEIK